MNKSQVTALFEREAVLLGERDCVPDSRAAALFGEAAVEHAHNLNTSRPGWYANGYGIGGYTLFALTFRGFQAAASYYNAQKLRGK